MSERKTIVTSDTTFALMSAIDDLYKNSHEVHRLSRADTVIALKGVQNLLVKLNVEPTVRWIE